MSTVTVRIPPEAGHVPLLRTTVAGIAARAQFTLDEVDDLRMAVEEAAVLLLRQAGKERLDLDVSLGEDRLEAVISIGGGGDGLDEHSFSWQILSALADEIRSESVDGRSRIVLVKYRAAANPPAATPNGERSTDGYAAWPGQVSQ